MSCKIVLVGDYNPEVPAHQGILLSLDKVVSELGLSIQFEWLPTRDIQDEAQFQDYQGIWCVPSTPYENTDGALLSIHFARTHNIPFLGTCGGFQHAIVEYARNALAMHQADHSENNPNAEQAVIAPLACSLVEVTEEVTLFDGSRIAEIYGKTSIFEGYRCNYGLNPEFKEALLQGPLVASANDATTEIRAVELTNHPFFIATLFQPERAVLSGEVSPLVKAFVLAVQNQAEQNYH